MFSFYEINAMSIIIVFITAIVTYIILNKFIPEEKKSTIINAGSALAVGIVLSILVSYMTIEPDNLLTEGYWE